MGSLGIPELIVLFGLALLIFGPRKLPELGRTIGKALSEFRRASNELRNAVEDEMRELDRHNRELETKLEEPPDGPQLLPPEGEPVGSGSIAPPESLSASSASEEAASADGHAKPA